MKRFTHYATSALCLTLAWALFSPAQARTGEDQRRDLLMVLSAHEYRVQPKILQGIGPRVGSLLIEISGLPLHRPRVRNHAIMALSVFPSEQTRRYLESLLMEPTLMGSTLGTLLRRQSLRTLGRAFGGASVVPISNLIDDEEPQIRIAVAHALGDTQSAQAKPILAAWLPNEQELAVREAVDRALSSLRRSVRP